MKLYFSPGACSLAPHIVLRELGTKVDLVKVDMRKKETEEGNFLAINPKGYVPAIKLPDGQLLTEVAVMLQYLSDQNQAKNLFPKFGSMERYHAMEWMNFIATEFHKGIGAFFNPAMTEEVKKATIEAKLSTRLKFFDDHLAKNKWIIGSDFSIADAYAFTVLRWTHPLKIDLTPYKNILAFMERVQARPAVAAAIEAETGKH